MTFDWRHFLARRWFLLALACGCVVAAAWPAALDWTRLTPPRWIMPITLFLSAATMPSRRLLQSLRAPWAACWAVVLGYTVPPLLGWGFGHILIDDYRIGLLVCSAVPCTLASAVIWTRLASGDDATALLATFVSTGISWLVTTAWLALTTGDEVVLGFGTMMRDLALTLVLPVALGQLLRAAPSLARFATRRQSMLSVLARLLVLLILFRAAHDLAVLLRERSEAIALAPFLAAVLACLATHLLALLAGWWSAKGLKFGRSAGIAVAFASSQKTLPVSLVLLDLVFPNRPLAVVPLLVYHAGQLTLDTVLAERWAASPKAVVRV
jgi:solute carrier family 10 (sodium/bile acid cotransporter), member 7